MASCCAGSARPRVHSVNGCSDVSDGSMWPDLPIEGNCVVPVSPFRDIRSQLTDLRHHQEKLFRKLIDQHMDIQGRLQAIQADCKASMHRQAFLEQRQEHLITAFQNSSPQSRRVSFTEGTQKVQDADGLAQEAERINTECGMELVGDVCLTREPAQVQPEGDEESSNNEGALRREESRMSQRSQTMSKSKSSLMKIGVSSCDSQSQESQRKVSLDRMLRSKEFEIVMSGAIMINALIMCWECQYKGLDVGFHLQYPGRLIEAQVVWSGADSAFMVLDWTFGSLFFLEMFVKLCCWRRMYFFDFTGWELECENCEMGGWQFAILRCLWSVRGWNILDMSLVLTFLFDKAASAFISVSPQMLRLLRLVRLFRLVRLLRFMESLDHLYIMTTAISGLSKVLSWAVVLLTIMLTICGLFLVQMLHETYFNNVSAADLSEVQLERHHKMYEYFGTFTRCMLSMFEITLGNWPPVARLLSEEVSEWFTLICLVHKLTIGFAVIGVITGVILQETFKVAQTDDLIMFRQKKRAKRILRQKMKLLFEALDESGDGKLDKAEFQTIGDFPDIRCWLSSLDVETDDLKTLYSLIDVHGHGYVTLDELVERMPRVAGHAKGVDMLALRHNFETHQ